MHMVVSPQPSGALFPHSSPGAGPSTTAVDTSINAQPKTFRRLRTSLEHTLRAAAGSKTRAQQQQTTPVASPSSIMVTRKLRHKTSASDSNLLPEPSQMKTKGKQRVSVDFVGVGRERERVKERERVEEKENQKGATARFSVGGGLRRLESKVGLRRLGSKEITDPSQRQQNQQQQQQRGILSTSASMTSAPVPSKLREVEREKDKEGATHRTRSRSAWSFLAPTLSSNSKASASTTALDLENSTGGLPRQEHEAASCAPSGGPISGGGTDANIALTILPTGADINHASVPSPTSQLPPSRSSASRSRAALTSPSTPSLSSPTSANPSSVRPRPAPIISVLPQNASPLSSPTAKNASRSTTMPSSASARSIPSSPTTPTTPTNLASSAHRRTASPTPTTPVRQSRPPLSPSAAANSGNRSRLRQPSLGTTSARNASTTSLPGDAHMSAPVPEKPARPERSPRRRSLDSGSQSKASGRTTPTGAPSYAAPTTVSRARAKSTREHSIERERERMKQREQLVSTGSRGSASATPLNMPEVARSRSPSLSHPQTRATSPTPGRSISPSLSRAMSPQPVLRDTIRHASALLLRELNGPRPRSPALSQPASSLQAMFPLSISAPVVSDREGLTSEAWEECDARLRLLARSEKMRVGGPYGGSTASLVGASGVSGGSTTAGEERERRIFAEALRDGYVLCQLANKLRPGVIPRADAREDGFKAASNATKFLAAAAGAFNLPQSELFQRDDLIKGTPEALFRVARTVVAVVARAGEDAETDRIAQKILLGGGSIQDKGQPVNGPYGTRSKAASSSTPNLSTLQRSASPPTFGAQPRKKRWSPPSPALSTVAGEDTASGSGTQAAPSQASASKGNTTKGKENLYTSSSSSSKMAPHAEKVVEHMSPRMEDESALVTDSEDEDELANEQAGDDEEKVVQIKADPQTVKQVHAIFPSFPIDAPLARETAQIQISSSPSLLGAARPRDSAMSGVDRTSTQFGTMRTATTMATSFVPSEHYRADVSVSASEASTSAWLWEELSASSAPSASAFASPSMAKRPLIGIRDRRLSEVGLNNDLTRVAEEAEEGTLRKAAEEAEKPPDSGAKRRAQAIQLGKGKWPEDFVDAFKPGSPPRFVMRRTDAEHGREALPAGRLTSIAADVGANESNASPQNMARRPLHRPRHSIDVPQLRPKGRENDGSPGRDGSMSVSRVVPRRSNSSTRHIYVPRSNSASPSPSPDAHAHTSPNVTSPLSSSPGLRVPFPCALSNQDTKRNGSPGTSPSGAEVAATTAAATAAQLNRFARGRFQSEVDSTTRRKPRPNSYDELGAMPRRSRIESMISLGGASSSNFSASDIRSSMDGSAVRKTLIIRDEGKPTTHFQLGNCIGRGQFGSVYRALNLNTGQMVAVKRIRLEGISEDEVKQLMKEVDVVKSLSHPSIVKYEGMSRDTDTLNIVLEYAENGSLGQILKAFGGRLNEKLVATYVIKILEGLDYLHRNDVVHCDLKAANILTTKTGNVKLSDFGVSLNLRKVGGDHKTDVTGTPNWMAPEVIELKGASRASDIWSLGCTVIELLTGKPPYAEISNGMSVMYRIVDDPMPPIPEDWSPLLKDFLERCFRREPAFRPSAEELFEHAWLKEHCEVHKVIRQKESIPFLRRVSQDLQQRPATVVEAVRFVELSRADSKTSDSPKPRSEEGRKSPLPTFLTIPSSPERRSAASSKNPTTPMNPTSEAAATNEHSFVKTAFGKPIPCRVCLQPVKKNAVVCEECALIAHARCAPNAPPTCILRAQLLQIANSSPTADSPNPMDIIRQFTPSTSPVPDTMLQTPTSEVVPPTAFRMFGAFRRSHSSLSPTDTDAKPATNHLSVSQTSQDGSSESVLAQAHARRGQSPRQAQHNVLVKSRPHPVPVSGDTLLATKSGSSYLSNDTNGDSIDLSDESYSQAHSHANSALGHSSHNHSNSTSYTYSRSQVALSTPTQVPAQSRSQSQGPRVRRRKIRLPSEETEPGTATDLELGTETEAGPSSRLSLAVSAADSADPQRLSVLADSGVGGYDDDYDGLSLGRHLDHVAWRSRARPKQHQERDKGCILQ